MDKLNFVLQFKLAGDPNLRVHGAARIKIDGRGGLIVYCENGAAEKLLLSELIDLSIQPMWLRAHTAA